MFKHCPECGYKLEKEYKFCPECGCELKKIENVNSEAENTPVPPNHVEINRERIICDNCGEENDKDNVVCSSCGVKLQAGTYEKPPKAEQKKNRKVSGSVDNKSKSNKKNKPFQQTPAKKQLNLVKTITVVVVGVGIALFILLFSGVLNPVVVPGSSSSSTTDNSQNSGVDLGNVQKINQLEDVIKNNPRDTASILQLAHLKNDSGMYQQAIVNYKEYLALVPTDPDARIDMGICYYNLQNYPTAIAEMQKAIQYDPKHQIGYLDLGIVNLAAGNFDKSRDWLKKAVDLDPNSEFGKKAEELLKSHMNQTNGGK